MLRVFSNLSNAAKTINLIWGALGTIHSCVLTSGFWQSLGTEFAERS
jgi:hypothetical protein